MTDRDVWATRAGVEIRIKDLTDDHLQNILRMIYQKRGA